MSDSDEELTAEQQLAQLITQCALAEPVAIAAAAAATPHWDWSAFQDNVAALYRCNLHAPSRERMAAVPYADGWGVLLRRGLALLPLSADVAANGADGPPRALSLSRLFTIMRNLCTFAPFQQQLRGDMQALISADSVSLQHCIAVVRAMERALAHDVAVKETSLLLKSLLQLWANMLTPAADVTNAAAACDDDASAVASWQWLHTSLRTSVLGPVLRLHRQQPELASIVTGIVHHALLRCCSALNAAAPLLQDVSASGRAAVADFLSADVEGAKLIVMLLDAAMHGVEAQLERMDATAAADPHASASAAVPAPATVWDWDPLQQQRDPAWIVHVVGLACRTSSTFISELQPRVGAQHWLLLLRLLELWSEGLQHTDTTETERAQKQQQAPAAGVAAPTLEHTAEAVATNMACLVSWLQAQPRQPLPQAAPAAAQNAAPSEDAASAGAAASAAVSSVPPSTTIGVDCASNSLLNLLSNVLLLESWSGRSVVSSRVRDSLLAVHTPAMLLELLDAADKLDGGTMFSELYNNARGGGGGAASAAAVAAGTGGGIGGADPLPPGHTRHTRSSDDPTAYVNQFASGDRSSSAAAAVPSAAASSSSVPSAAARSVEVVIRSTPYCFKSHLLRLMSALCHGSRAWQDALGSGGVYACLNHSVLDEWNPLMREHSVLALRNLLEGHEENQAVVANLRAQGIANKEQLQQNGIEAQLDEDTGKVRVNTRVQE